MGAKRFRRPRRVMASLVALTAVAAFGLWPGAGGTSGAPASSTVLATFNAAGTYTWTVPTLVSKITFDVFGASGGNVASSIPVALGGPGGEAKVHLAVKPGQTFEIVVGGRGGDNSGTTGGSGGFNGGGTGGSDSPNGDGGGGGGSDVRIGGRGNACATTQSCGLVDRFVVAGGGGGAGDGLRATGGAGGGVSGAGVGGGQQEGPFCSPQPDTAGCFGAGGTGVSPFPGGGGGGGWYGGNGGVAFPAPAGGAGGSGFITGVLSSSSFPGGTHSGDGLITITTP